MADPDSVSKLRCLAPESSPRQPQQRKSSSFLCKSLVIVLLLVLLSLFPSEAPEFVNHTFLAKHWELLHLLFIGIAVSYGLFGRKIAGQDSEIEPQLEDPQPYLSSILHFSSIFDAEYENPCGSGEKMITQKGNYQCLQNESMVVGPNERFPHDEYNPRSATVMNGLGNPSALEEENVSQTCNFQHFQGESMVGSAQENCLLNEWVKPRSVISQKGLENISGLGEGKVIQNCSFQYFQSESVVGFAQEHCVLNEWIETRSLTFQNDLENPSGLGVGKMSRTCDLQYFQGESMVSFPQDNEWAELRLVTSQNDLENPPGFGLGEGRVSQTSDFPNCHGESTVGLNEWVKPKSIIEYKQLNLPVRSLRSDIVEDENRKDVDEDECSSDSDGSCKKSNRSRNGEVRGLNPLNLDDKFKETVHLPSSPLPWRSKSNRMEVKEASSNVQPTSHSRPLSVGEFELTHLKSDSFWSPIFLQTRSMPSLAEEISPTSTISVKVQNQKMEGLERQKKSFCSLSSQASHSSSMLRNDGASLLNSNVQGFSIGSLSEINVERSSNNNLKDFSRSMGEIPLERGKSSDSLDADMKPPATISISSLSEMNIQGNCDDNLKDFSENKRENPLSTGKKRSDTLNMKPTSSISVGSLSEMNMQRNCDDGLNDFGKSIRDSDNNLNDFSKREQTISMGKHRDALNACKKKPPTSVSIGSISEMNMKRNCDVKPSACIKPLPRGKSVRTIRSSKPALQVRKKEGICSDQTDASVKEICDMSEVISTKNQGRKARNKQGDVSLEQSSNIFRCHNDGEKQYFAETNVVECRKDLENKLENFQVSSDEEEPQKNTLSDSELDSEVDRKAGEFIARFKEQIRLQKVASLNGLSGW